MISANLLIDALYGWIDPRLAQGHTARKGS
jgi:ABC-type dipeptide/oligopeptide/nickel transport system permease component